MNFNGDEGMQRFFRRFGMPDGSAPNAPHQRSIGQGSGFFMSADGYAVTNHHVVDKAESVEVMTDDGKTYTAKVIGTDPKTDLALIKVEGGRDFPFVKLSEKTSRVGDWVVAVGNPFGLGGTVTAGIVSARGRDIGAGPYDDFIQIDAPVNSGNSGDRPSTSTECDRRQHGDLLAVRRLGGHRLRDSCRHGEICRCPALTRCGDARMDRRANPAGERRDCRQPRAEDGGRRSSPSRSPTGPPPRPASWRRRHRPAQRREVKMP